MNVEQTDFARICDANGECHCDWRLVASNCVEANEIRIMYIVEAVASGILAITASFIILQRVIYNNQTFFDCRTGIPRPKPIESMGLFGIIFHVLRVIHAVIIITDAAPNLAFRSFFFELPWQFLFCAVACYMFGIAHTLSSSSRVLYDNWVRSPHMIDGVCFIIIILPFLSNNITSISSGVYAVRGDLSLAGAFTNASYYCWTVYTAFLGVLIFYAGFRLIRLLRRHFIEKPGTTAEDVEKFALSALKVKIIILTASLCLFVFTIVLVLFASLREQILAYTPYNLAVGIIIAFNGVVGTGIVIFAVILNPRVATLTGLVTSSSGGGEHNGGLSTTSRMSKWLNSRMTTTTQSTNTVVGPELTKQQSRMPPLEKKSMDIVDMGSPRASTSSPSASRQRQQSIELAEQGQIQSRVEEERLQYNAMTSTIRAPPRVVVPYDTEDHNDYRV
ncbi:hypothetical protein BDA99DRAFT_590854 [Phascolomyces articulosus]|uniref:Uncharacterized protein n=1 Tax=Phascolomyces articulosus TaxID=60185 RepID=A0AAD5KKF0_9FUNG|nr:hypothetical protein BDA99DRAFT_590854 [Phascolomyces articulosus]